MATVTNVYEFMGMNAEDMKGSYKRLVKKLHPDVSGYNSTEDMKILNSEFAWWYAHSATKETRETKTDNRPQSADYYRTTYNDDFAKNLAGVVEWMISHSIFTREDLTAEICGVFIWVSGIALRDEPDTRATLKNSGFRYSADKRSWFFTPTSTAGMMATGKSLDAIRNTYGSMKINGYKSIGD
jgi:hypothetical protein